MNFYNLLSNVLTKENSGLKSDCFASLKTQETALSTTIDIEQFFNQEKKNQDLKGHNEKSLAESESESE